MNYLVALNILSSLAHLSTDTPSGFMSLVLVNIASMIEHITTKQSKRLNNDTKYAWKPKLYILMSISNVKITTNIRLAISAKNKNSSFKYKLKRPNQEIIKHDTENQRFLMAKNIGNFIFKPDLTKHFQVIWKRNKLI